MMSRGSLLPARVKRKLPIFSLGIKRCKSKPTKNREEGRSKKKEEKCVKWRKIQIQKIRVSMKLCEKEIQQSTIREQGEVER